MPRTYKLSGDIHAFDSIGIEEAYWLGIIFSDGCLCSTTDKRKTLNLSSNDKEMIAKFYKFMKLTSKIGEYVIPANGKISYNVAISNEYLFNKLLSYGCVPRKSSILEPPKINEKYFMPFLCGYFDGDGCISKNRTINSWKVAIGFGSKPIWDWFNDILIKNNIIFSKEEKHTKNHMFYTSVMNGISGKRFLSLLYDSLPDYLPIKYKKDRYLELSGEKLRPPMYQGWEIEIMHQYGVDIAMNIINSHENNIGWTRTREALMSYYRHHELKWNKNNE